MTRQSSERDSGGGAGDLWSDEEFADFALSVAPMLHRTAWLLTSDAAASEDLVQEALARVYVTGRRGRSIDNPAAYVRTILLRLYIDGRRLRSSSEVVTDHLPDEITESDMSSTLVLRAAMSGLRREDQAVLVLRYFLEFSVAEAAQELNISQGAVRTRTSRAMQRLRHHLGDSFAADAQEETSR